MDEHLIRISLPTELVSVGGLLGQAIYINDKCYILKGADLSPNGLLHGGFTRGVKIGAKTSTPRFTATPNH